MRWVLVVVGVVVVAFGAVMLVRFRSGTGDTDAQTPEGAQTAAPGAGSEAGGRGESDGLSPGEREALAELEQELGRAAPVAYRTDEERLADARAWVAANRPADRPFNELEAKMLALMDVLADSDKRSAEWTMNMSQIEVEMIRALDVDGDGQVSDDEVQLFIDDNMNSLLNPMEHPYLQEKFDSDGDGTVSPEEMMGFASQITDGALAGAIERGRLEAWDADDDGFVSEDERVAGEQAAYEKVDEMFGQFAPGADLGGENLSEEQRAAVAQQMESMREQLDSTREMMAAQMAAQELMEAMRLDNLASPDPADMMADMPQPPDAMSFDVDRDGVMQPDETVAQAEAMTAYQDEVERWGAEMTARRLREQFDHATSQHDADGDGRMSEPEWEGRIGDLLDERDTRLLLRSYDLDGSGRVEAGELSTFLDWYRRGSLRADVNYDGDVDGRDLEQMAVRFQQQGR